MQNLPPPSRKGGAVQMNHQTAVTLLIDQLKNDKSKNAKWRNKIVSRLEEIEAMLHKLDSREMTKSELDSLVQTAPSNAVCICPAGVRVVGCPVHG